MMMRFKFCFSLIFLFILVGPNLNSQDFDLKWGAQKKHSFLGDEYTEYLTTINGDHYFLILYNYKNLRQNLGLGFAGNCQFHIRKETTDGGIDLKILPYMEEIAYWNHFVSESTLTIFYSNREKGAEEQSLSVAQIDLLNPGRPRSVLLVEKVKKPLERNHRDVVVGTSDGGFLISTNKNNLRWKGELQLYIKLDAELNKVWERQQLYEATPKEEIGTLNIFERKEGGAYILTSKNWGDYQLITVDPTRDEVSIQPLEFGDIQMRSMISYLKDDRIVLFGLGSEESDAKTYYAQINPVDGTISDPLLDELGWKIDKMNKGFSEALLERGYDYLSYFVFRKPHFLADGSTMFIAERGTIFSETGPRSGLGDILVFKINENEGLEWFNRLQKKQHETGFMPFSSIFHFFMDDNLFLIYNDHEDNLKRIDPEKGPSFFEYHRDSKLFLVKILPDGSMDKGTLQDNDSSEFILQPVTCTRLEDGQFLIYGKKDKSGKRYSIGWLSY